VTRCLQRNGQLDEQEAAQAMRSVLTFLADCHSTCICYGDVKPSNFLLKSMYPSVRHMVDPTKPKGVLTVKAADLGSSQQFHPSLKLRRTVGTLMYMAPEVFTHSYGPEVDMWSAGVMMFQLLTGRFPFWDVNADFVQRLSADLVTPTIRQGEAIYNTRIWSKLSHEAFDLVSSMMHKDPQQRITAQQALEHPWFQQQLAASHSSAHATLSNNIVPMTGLHS
jgi:calcium-dependent protein kinase